MKLTKEDVRVLRWACNSVKRHIEDDPSGDLFTEELAEMATALSHLPKIKDLPC